MDQYGMEEQNFTPQQQRMTFSDLFEKYLNHHLVESFKNKSMSTGLAIEVEHMLYEKVRTLVNKCNFSLEENTYKFISKMYLSDIEINGLRPFSIEKYSESKLVSDADLSMLTKLFFDNEIGDVANEELRRRSK
jgi:hypothetical protein